MPNNNGVAKLTRIVQCSLLPGDQDVLIALKSTPEEIMKQVEWHVLQGWRMELMLNNQYGGFSVLAKASSPALADAGIGFYSNGDTLRAALLASMYKLTLPEGESLESFFSKRVSGNSFG